MQKNKFAALIIVGLFMGAGAAQATSAFPTAAEEGSGSSVNAPLPANTNAVIPTGFPAAALEGGEANEQAARVSTRLTNTEHYSSAKGSVFPSTAIE